MGDSKLEDQFAAQFENPGIECAVYLPEGVALIETGAEKSVLGGVAGIQPAGLGVIEGVERFEAQFEMGVFGDDKRFVKRGGEVHTIRRQDCVLADVSEAHVGATLPHRHDVGELGGVEPLPHIFG